MRDILEAALKTGSASLATTLLAIVAAKIFAVVIGPSGVGTYSIATQALQVATILATVGGATALIQGIASHSGEEREAFQCTALWVMLGAAGVVCLLLALAAPWLGPLMLPGTPAAARLFLALTLPLALAMALTFISAVLNGNRAIGRLAIINLAGSAAGTALAWPIAHQVLAGRPEAFALVLATSSAVSCAVGLAFAAREGWLGWLWRMPGGFRPELARKFLGLAAATALAGLIGTGTVLVVRTAVSRYLGLDALGFFSVAWTVSMTYVTLVLGSFGTYYLPTLAAIAEPAERNALIRRFLRFGIIASTPLVVAVIVAKPLLVSLLYTDAFLETLATMRWMLVGDYLKITAWVLAMPIVAYARARAFTWSEILTHAGFLAFSVPALRFTGQGEWVGVGFMLMYVGYLAFTATYVRKVHGFPFERATILPWLGGLAIVAAASAATWTARTMSWPLAIGFVAAAVAFSWVALTPWEREELGRIVSQRLGRTAPT